MATAVSSVQNLYPDDADNKSLLNTGNHLIDCKKVKGKAVPLQARSGPEGSRNLKIPRFHDNGKERW
jgi:hypothetical protein